MPGHIEGDDAKVFGEFLVGQQVAPLPRVGARGVQAHQRNACTVFLEIDPMRLAADLDMDVATDDRLDIAIGTTAHADTVAKCGRGNASTSLKYCKFAMKGCRSPSSTASPR